ncbi:MAG: non-ribosomal peptide synthetase, partial [Chloroflexota bacterium]
MMIQTYSPVSSPLVDIRQSVHRCIEQHVERYADRVALKTRTRALTYRDMNAAANGLALQLRPIITPQTFVATLLDENIDIMVAILAICKAGGIWVPLDGRLPARTKNALLERVEITAIIAEDSTLSDAHELSPDTPVVNLRSAYENATVVNLPYDGDPEDLFCLWMTGGTTGVFKAMATTHEQRLHGPSYSANDASIVSSDRSVYFGSLNFGAAFGNVANAFFCGATTHFLNPIQETPASVFQWMCDERVTIFTCSPSLFRSIFAQPLPAPLPALRLIRANSEPLLQADFELFKRTFPAGQAKLMNIYATTEASYLTHFMADHTTQLDGTTLIPVGRQSTTTEVYVLDEHGNKIIDETGEIVVRGRLVPEGYWRAPELSEGKFLVDSSDPDYRIVHSGDRGIMRADGNLLHLGRMDSMVKIRGFRVELMDIENLLRKHPAIAQATVQTLDDQGVTRLVAYIVPYRGSAAPSASQLREMLSENLPDFMLPSQYIVMDEIPLMPNGKIDTHALPRPQVGEQTSLVPATATEGVLLELLRKVLPAPIIHRDDNFFDLGGNSLGAMRLIADINQHFGVNLTPGSIYDYPSLVKLAEFIDQGAPSSTSLVTLNPYGTQPPLVGISGIGGNPLALRHLVANLGYDFPFYVFPHPEDLRVGHGDHVDAEEHP